eukprot:1155142-Pelagomonas_calceolata.AAC.1
MNADHNIDKSSVAFTNHVQKCAVQILWILCRSSQHCAFSGNPELYCYPDELSLYAHSLYALFMMPVRDPLQQLKLQNLA